MDVSCTKCGIEYEFDDAKVTLAGVTVKCTACGHIFKVKREELVEAPALPTLSVAGRTASQVSAAKVDGGDWMVRRVDGQTSRFKELTTLQKWIVERKVGRDDEISKTGKTWKRLGEIAELASFFQVVEAANAAIAGAAPSGESFFHEASAARAIAEASAARIAAEASARVAAEASAARVAADVDAARIAAESSARTAAESSVRAATEASLARFAADAEAARVAIMEDIDARRATEVLAARAAEEGARAALEGARAALEAARAVAKKLADQVAAEASAANFRAEALAAPAAALAAVDGTGSAALFVADGSVPHVAAAALVAPMTAAALPANSADATSASLVPAASFSLAEPLSAVPGPASVAPTSPVPVPVRSPDPVSPASLVVRVSKEPLGTRADARLVGDVRLDLLDDDDPVLQMIKRRKRNSVLALVLLSLVFVGVTALALWPLLSGTASPPPMAAIARPAIDAAQQALRDDRPQALATARAAIAADDDPLAQATQVSLDVTIAAQLRHQARALLALEDPVLAPAAKAKQDEATALLAKAYATLRQLRAQAPQLVELHLASASYNLQEGAPTAQRTDLEKARAAARAPGANAAGAATVDAEIAVGQALADAAAALAGDAAAAAAALALFPVGSDDGRLRSARAALAVAALSSTPGEPELNAARAAVEALPAPDERREHWLRLLDKKGQKPAAASIAAPDDLKALSYEEIMRQAERAVVNEKSKIAYELFVRATKLKPLAPRPWLGVGWASLELARNPEAIRAFQKALSLDAKLAEAHFGMAEALKFSGRPAEAKAAYGAYLRLEPNGRDAAVAKRALDSL